jgi:hypothetical protein
MVSCVALILRERGQRAVIEVTVPPPPFAELNLETRRYHGSIKGLSASIV